MRYGFATRKKIHFFKMQKCDTEDIVGLYKPENQRQREVLTKALSKQIETEEDDLNNFSFVVRNRNGNAFGIITFETENYLDYEVFIWIPDAKSADTWKEYLVETLLQYIEEYTDIQRVSKITFIRNTDYEVVGTDYNFVA